jgi:squalene-hopene/tetraprenyl-beta-curcumene cyclase
MDVLQTLVQEKITRSQNWFFARQNPDGHWRAELEGDALLQGELVIILAFLGKEDSPLAKRLAQQLINTQARTVAGRCFRAERARSRTR